MARMALVILSAACLAACSTTPTNLESKAEPKTQSYSENYQEIYRRVATTAKRCFAADMGQYASMAVDAELYPDLGRGELTVSLVNYGTRNYYLSAKIARATPQGSTMTVSAGNTLGAERMTNLMFDWARSDGNAQCPLI